MRAGDRGLFGFGAHTDAEGRYTLEGLVPGAHCEAWINDLDESDPEYPAGVEQHSLELKAGAENTFPDALVRGGSARARDTAPSPQPAPGAARPATVPSGPSRAEIADLIRAIGRDPVSADLVDRVAAWYHPRFLLFADFARMRQVATDPENVRWMDRLAREALGRPLDTTTLMRFAGMSTFLHDDAMWKQTLREWAAEGALPEERGSSS
jgi:hypothetical protein